MQQPVVVYINAAQLGIYGGGVLPVCPSSQTGHAVLAVGYNRKENWIKFQNSW